MALKERIRDEMKAALLGGDRFVGDTLRNLNAAILNEEVACGKRDVARATDVLACETHWVMEYRIINYLTHARRRTRRLAGFVAETARTAASGAASVR